MKLLFVFGICLIFYVQSSLSIGKEKIPPFRPPKDDKIDDMLGLGKEKKDIQKRDVSGGLGKKIPPIVPEEKDKINGIVAEHLIDKRDVFKHDDGTIKGGGDDLPALLKTLRLRPGSDEYNRVIEEYINAKKEGEEEDNGQQQQQNLEQLGNGDILDYLKKVRSEKIHGGKKAGDENVDEPRLLGEPLIGKNRHPSAAAIKDEEKPADEEQKGNGGILDYLKKIGSEKIFGGKKEDSPKRTIKEENSNGGVLDYLKKVGSEKIFGSGKNLPVNEEASKNKDVDEPRLLGEPLIGKNRHPSSSDAAIKNEDDKPVVVDKEGNGSIEDYLKKVGSEKVNGRKELNEGRPKRSVDESINSELPALLKTLRLRPGSDAYNKIVDDFVNSRKEDKPNNNNGERAGHHDSQESHEHRDIDNNDDDLDVDVQPLGRELIGAFHRPPFRPSKEGGDKPVNVVPCKDEDRKQVLKCFRGYFKNFDINLVDDTKLPSMFEIYMKIKKIKDYKKQQQFFNDFSGCFKSTPETCYHAGELSKIAHQPEEADYLATYFTLSEFMFKSKHNKKVAKCFIKQVKECANHKFSDFKECDTAKEILTEAIEKFNKNCDKVEPQNGDLKALLKPFLQRTSLGPNCPSLLSDINV